MPPPLFSSHQLIPMTNQLIELQTINDQELQTATGGRGYGKGIGRAIGAVVKSFQKHPEEAIKIVEAGADCLSPKD